LIVARALRTAPDPIDRHTIRVVRYTSKGAALDIDSFPVGLYLIFTGATLGLCIGLSLLIAAHLSEDKETGILRQLWQAFFARSTTDAGEPDHRKQGKGS
jgi:hypothetical protein